MAQPLAQPCDSGIIKAEPCPREFGRYISVSQKRMVLTACVLASSMAFIDGSALTVALPKLRAAFGAGLASVQWVLNGYVLALAASDADRRRARRRLRQVAHARIWLPWFGAGVGGLRVGAARNLADRRARRAGRRRGDCDAGESGAHRRDISRKTSATPPSACGRRPPRSPPPAARCSAAGSPTPSAGIMCSAINPPVALAAVALVDGLCAGRCARAAQLRHRRRGHPRLALGRWPGP